MAEFPTTASPKKKKTTTLKDEVKAEAKRFQDLMALHRNTFTATPMFRSMCDQTFKTVDVDKSGTVNLSEAYIAVLLFYSKMSMFVKGLIPPSIDEVRDLLIQVAGDEKEIDADHFVILLTMLLEHLIFRVLLQILITFVVIPPLAAKLWDLYYNVYLTETFLFSICLPRAIGVNFVVTLLISTAVPLILRTYEKTTEHRLTSSSKKLRMKIS